MHKSIHSLASFLVISVCFALASCSEQKPKIIHIETVIASHVIIYSDNKTRIGGTELESLDAFIRSIPVGAIAYVDIATYDYSALGNTRAQHIKAHLLEQGIATKLIHQSNSTHNNNHTLVLTIEYTKAVPPKNCPDWSKNSIMDYSETDHSNLGCATYSNIAAQVYDPADLERGSGAPTISGARDSVYITNYIAGTPPATGATSSSSSSAGASSASR